MISKREKILPWWITPILAGFLIYVVLHWVDVDTYQFNWPVLPIGFLSWWCAELLMRAANEVIGRARGSSR